MLAHVCPISKMARCVELQSLIFPISSYRGAGGEVRHTLRSKGGRSKSHRPGSGEQLTGAGRGSITLGHLSWGKGEVCDEKKG